LEREVINKYHHLMKWMQVILYLKKKKKK
jgi:hypothetical protein